MEEAGGSAVEMAGEVCFASKAELDQIASVSLDLAQSQSQYEVGGGIERSIQA